MRKLLFLTLLAVLVCAVSAFSLLREFDDERLLPHLGRVIRAASKSQEVVENIGSGQEGSGERVPREAELEASGEEPKKDETKVRQRRDDIAVGSGQEESSGEEPKKPAIRIRRAAEADEVEASGQEGSGQA